MRGIKKISKNNHIQWKFEKTLIEWYHINTAIGLDYLTYFGGRTPPPSRMQVFFMFSLNPGNPAVNDASICFSMIVSTRKLLRTSPTIR